MPAVTDLALIQADPSPTYANIEISAYVNWGQQGVFSSPIDDGGPGFFWRLQDTSNYYYVYLNGSTQLELGVVTAGTQTPLATYSFAASESFVGTIRIVVSNDAHSVYLDNVLYLTVTDTTITAAGGNGVTILNGFNGSLDTTYYIDSFAVIEEVPVGGGSQASFLGQASLSVSGSFLDVEGAASLSSTATLSPDAKLRYGDFEIVSYRYKVPGVAESDPSWAAPIDTYIEALPGDVIQVRFLVKNIGPEDSSNNYLKVVWRRDDGLGWMDLYNTPKDFQGNARVLYPYISNYTDLYAYDRISSSDNYLIPFPEVLGIYGTTNGLMVYDYVNEGFEVTGVSTGITDTVGDMIALTNSLGITVLFFYMYDGTVRNPAYARSLDGGRTWEAQTYMFTGTAVGTDSVSYRTIGGYVDNNDLFHFFWAGNDLHEIISLDSSGTSWPSAADVISSGISGAVSAAYNSVDQIAFVAVADTNQNLVSWYNDSGSGWVANSVVSIPAVADTDIAVTDTDSGDFIVFISDAYVKYAYTTKWNKSVANIQTVNTVYLGETIAAGDTGYIGRAILIDKDPTSASFMCIGYNQYFKYTIYTVAIDINTLDYFVTSKIDDEPAAYDALAVTKNGVVAFSASGFANNIALANFSTTTTLLIDGKDTTQLLGTGTFVPNNSGQQLVGKIGSITRYRDTSLNNTIPVGSEFEVEILLRVGEGFTPTWKYEIGLATYSRDIRYFIDSKEMEYLFANGANPPAITTDMLIRQSSTGDPSIYEYYADNTTTTTYYLDLQKYIPYVPASVVFTMHCYGGTVRIYLDGALSIEDASNTYRVLDSAELTTGQHTIRVEVDADGSGSDIYISSFYFRSLTSVTSNYVYSPDYNVINTTPAVLYYNTYQARLRAGASVTLDARGSITSVQGSAVLAGDATTYLVGVQSGSILGKFLPVATAEIIPNGYKGVTVPADPQQFAATASTTISAIVYGTQQIAFRFRNDDGDETSASWVGPVNTTPYLQYNTNYRCRIAVQNTSLTSKPLPSKLRIEYSVNGGEWRSIGVGDNAVLLPTYFSADSGSIVSTIDVSGEAGASGTGMSPCAFFVSPGNTWHLIYWGQLVGEPQRFLYRNSVNEGGSWSSPISFPSTNDTSSDAIDRSGQLASILWDYANDELVIVLRSTTTTYDASTGYSYSYPYTRVITSTSDGLRFNTEEPLPVHYNKGFSFRINSAGEYLYFTYELVTSNLYDPYMYDSSDRGRTWTKHTYADNGLFDPGESPALVDGVVNSDNTVDMYFVYETTNTQAEREAVLMKVGTIPYPYGAEDFLTTSIEHTALTGIYGNPPNNHIIYEDSAVDPTHLVVSYFERRNNIWSVPQPRAGNASIGAAPIQKIAGKYIYAEYQGVHVVYTGHGFAYSDIRQDWVFGGPTNAYDTSLANPVWHDTYGALKPVYYAYSDEVGGNTIYIVALGGSAGISMLYEGGATTQQITSGGLTFDGSHGIAMLGVGDVSPYEFPAGTLKEIEFGFKINEAVTNNGDKICIRVADMDDYEAMPCLDIITEQAYIAGKASATFAGWTDGPKINYYAYATLSSLGVINSGLRAAIQATATVTPTSKMDRISAISIAGTSQSDFTARPLKNAAMPLSSYATATIDSQSIVAPNPWAVQATAQMSWGAPAIDVYYRAVWNARAYVTTTSSVVRAASATFPSYAAMPLLRADRTPVCTSATVLRPARPDARITRGSYTLIMKQEDTVVVKKPQRLVITKEPTPGVRI